jgi:putative aldouronate transport system permease protein
MGFALCSKLKKKKRKVEGLLFEVIVDSFLVIILLIFIIPLWKVLMVSLNPSPSPNDPTFGLFPSPTQWSLAAYKQFLTHSSFLVAAYNSVRILLGGVGLSLFLTVPLAYVLSIQELPGRRFLYLLVLIPFWFNPGLIPNYILITNLGLIDKLPAVFLPGAVSVYNTLVMKSFFESLPKDIKESARIDGAKELTILMRIILPLSKPILLTIGLFYGVHFWNDFFSPLLYLNKPSLQPIPVLLRSILIASDINEYVDYNAFSTASVESLKAASVLIAALPLILAYPWIQKYFTKGTLIGSIKG